MPRITREPLKNVGGEALARRIYQKKRSLHAVNEHFFGKFNDASASKVIFQRFPRIISRLIACYCATVFLAVGSAGVFAADAADAARAADANIDARILAISRPEASGTFTQKRLFKGMSKPLISKGDFAYAQHKGLLWRTMAPIENELFADGQGVQTSQMGSTQTSSGKVEEKVTHLIFSLLAMDIGKLKEDFTVATVWQGDTWQLDLIPKSALIAAAIKNIVISGTSRLNYLQLTTQQGDVTQITFDGDAAPAAAAKLSAWLKR
jgi:hypothetical protein